MEKPYAHPEALVSTEWLAEHLGDDGLRVVEADVDTAAHRHEHIPGALGWGWQTQLVDPVRRDVLDPRRFARLMSESGINPDTTVVLYGDNHNWFACYAFWQLKLYRHGDVRLLNGGRRRWLAEQRPLTNDVPAVEPANYPPRDPDDLIRARREDIVRAIREGHTRLVDVRSPAEYTGKLIAPPGMTETAQRGGHIPSAINVPWTWCIRGDSTFQDAATLQHLFEGSGLSPHQETITYCRIGERSAYTWFVLKYLLGYPTVRNYDGSWTEWGNLVGAPIVQGDQPR
ncbi:sulfurtransferase [bacterium]|nr:sulfurtransferase [bacterium]